MVRNFAGHPLALWRLTITDGIVRTAYQIGKTPVLPLYAAMLGASDLMIGYVVAVSTATGLFLKPIVGALSDRTTRRIWLLAGLAVFAVAPFLYRFVETPQHLYLLRLLHGTATAIFGPVSLAYIAELGADRRAERLGIFGMARTAGYLIAPLVGAALLKHMPPEQVFTIIGALSLLAMLPALSLPAQPATRRDRPRLRDLVRAILTTRSFQLLAALEGVVYVATYALKAFLPVYALQAMRLDVLLIGLFFTLQEATHLVVRPLGGRLADRIGPLRTIRLGLGLMVAGFALLALAEDGVVFALVACVLGAGLGLVLPATLSLMAAEIAPDRLGAGMGALGALRNLSKIAGPVLAGAALTVLPYPLLFALAAGLLAATALTLGSAIALPREQGQGSSS